MPVEIRALTSCEREAIPAALAVNQAATIHDGVAPLNEASLLALETLQQHSPGAGAERGYLAFLGDDVVGVAVDAEADGSSVDLAAAPTHRRTGVGTALLEAVCAAHPAAAFWAHGSLNDAAQFASSRGLEPVRSLWVMTRPVTAEETFDVTLPDGLVARPYDSSEEQAKAWLAVNAAAFAHHPEQGRMTLEDFTRRRQEPWFDADGLLLVWDETGPEPTLAASHWTKREPGSDTGEVYVVAVAPAYQGRGLAKPLTSLGLKHLAKTGVKLVELYVEGDNEPAKAAYSRVGFTRSTGDTMYKMQAHSTIRSEGSAGE